MRSHYNYFKKIDQFGISSDKDCHNHEFCNDNFEFNDQTKVIINLI